MKLPNGYGTVYKNGKNRRKPFIVRITIGMDSEGKQLRKTIGYAANRAQGLEMLSAYHNDPYDINYKNLRFCDIWNDVILDIEKLVKNNKMSESNYYNLSLVYKNHLQPLYKDKILELKYKKLQDTIDNMSGGYTLKGFAKTICKKVFDKAINYYELPISNNPAERINVGEKPKVSSHSIYTDEEIEILWQHVDNDLVKIILINIYGGERPNEIFIAKRENIFIDKEYMITGSKTKAGMNRPIPIHPKVKHLIEHFMLGYSEYPFTTIYEKFNYNKFSREYVKLMKELNFSHTPYDARHTFITKMKKANANEFILKKIVGHSIEDITERVYTHREIQELIEEVKKID